MSKRILVFFLLLLLPFPATAADTPHFIFPAACTYGKTCWAVNYVDVDPAKNAVKDFTCNIKTYDAHKGTDFALGSVKQMRAGVDVLAAANGTVLRLRDGESDTLKTPEEFENIRKNTKECGNGVLIDHGNGLETIYCHLKKGSIVVKPHEKVTTGQKIAQIGQSGLAEFPHLHFGVMDAGKIIDPYTGVSNEDGCGKMKDPLWADPKTMTYEPVAIFNGGFRTEKPDFNAIQRGDDPNPATLSLNSQAFVFWGGFFNVEKGDDITLSIVDPDGKLFNTRRETIPKTRARQYYFTGRKIGDVQLKPGIYKGIVTLTRKVEGGADIARSREFTVKVTP